MNVMNSEIFTALDESVLCECNGGGIVTGTLIGTVAAYTASFATGVVVAVAGVVAYLSVPSNRERIAVVNDIAGARSGNGVSKW